MSLSKFKSTKPERSANTLADGRHDVKITRVVHLESDRMKDFSGTMKTEEELKTRGADWKDTQEQVGVIFVEGNGKTVIHRFNTLGFTRYDELPATKGFIKSSGPEGYALDQKTLKRVVNKTRTDQCENILNELFWNCQIEVDGEWEKLPEGSGLKDLINARVNVKVTHKKYDGKAVPPEVGSFRPYGYAGSTQEEGVEKPVAKDLDEGF